MTNNSQLLSICQYLLMQAFKSISKVQRCQVGVPYLLIDASLNGLAMASHMWGTTRADILWVQPSLVMMLISTTLHGRFIPSVAPNVLISTISVCVVGKDKVCCTREVGTSSDNHNPALLWHSTLVGSLCIHELQLLQSVT